MSNGFVHSVKVPRLYKTAASIARSVREDGASFKSLIYQKKHPNVSALYALISNTLQRGLQLDFLIRKTRILLNEPRLDPWLARVLITELIWGKQTVKSDSKPVQTVLSYEKQLREELKNINDLDTNEPCIKRVRKPRYVRINTLLSSVKEAISGFQNEGWTLLPKCPNYLSYLETLKSLSEPYFLQDFHIPELFVFPAHITFHDHGSYHDGQIVLQDKASCLPAYLLNPTPESTVIDMCAAPGMKTTHLAAIMKNSGKVYAVEIDAKRFQTLCEQVEITSCISVKPVNKDALTLDAKQCPNVEYILVDPSCSGSGMTDRKLIDPTEQKCQPLRMKNLQAFQVFLLRHALLSFPTAKKIIYSTCSINAEENEEVIDEVLADIKDAYKLVPAKDLFGENWLNYSSTKYNCADKCLYAKSEVDLCNGFFVAIFERNFDVPLPEYKRKGSNVENTEQPATVEDTSADISEEKQSRKRKKRGKKKHKVQETSDGAQTNEEKTKDLSDSLEIIEVPAGQVANGEIIVDLSDSLEIIEVVGEQVANEKPPKKKKKKSRELVEPAKQDECPTVQVDDEEPPKKKKKKSKHKDRNVEKEVEMQNEEKENAECAITENLVSDETSEKKKKKKKKRKKDVDVTE